MRFISEDVIESTIDLFEVDEKAYTKIQDEIVQNQLALGAVLTEENLKLLKDDEYDLLWFMLIVIYKSVQSVEGDLPVIGSKLLENIEESNWKMWNESKSKDFKQKLDPFFEDYDQEDLLAFIEDSLSDDEDMEVSNEGREVLFIFCKSMVDALKMSIK